jgi:hypothetical protein
VDVALAAVIVPTVLIVALVLLVVYLVRRR